MSSTADLQKLNKQKEELIAKIAKLQLQLDEAQEEKNFVEKCIENKKFHNLMNNTKNSFIQALTSSFEKCKKQFEESTKTPKNYDSDVPFRLSDDFADTSVFDDWVDQQMEAFRKCYESVLVPPSQNESNSNKNSPTKRDAKSNQDINQKNDDDYNLYNNDNDSISEYSRFCNAIVLAIAILFKTSELINQMIVSVGKVENADTGILLECRENIVEHWKVVVGDADTEVDPRFTYFFDRNPEFGEMLAEELLTMKEPFADFVAKEVKK
jgi:hypothetical protein